MEQMNLEHLDDWIAYRNPRESDQVLQALELRATGNRFEKAQRLRRWLLGNYDPEDFEPSQVHEYTARAHREQLRATFIAHECAEPSEPAEDYDPNLPHPLAWLSKDDIVQANLTRGIEQDTGTQVEEHVGDNGVNASSTHQRGPTQATRQCDQRQQPTPMDEGITGVDGHQYNMPPGFMEYIYGLHQKLAALENNMLQMTQLMIDQRASNTAAASSTRIDGQSGHRVQEQFSTAGTEQPRGGAGNHVGFQDTFTIFNSSSPAHPASGTNLTEPSRVDSAWGRGESGSERLNPATSRDVGQTVRKWNIRFDGKKSMSFDSFLMRLEECRRSSNLTHEQLFGSLSQLFSDVAWTWYCNKSWEWKCWDDFLVAGR